MSWRAADLSDLVFFQRGYDITKDNQVDGDVPVISSSGVSSYHSEAMAKGPGVVIGRKGSLGSVHYSEHDYWPHDTTLWSKDLKGNDAKFVYYYLKTLHLENFNVGNSNPTLNRNHIHNLQVMIPELSVQRSISSCLSQYDDLIEINRRRIELLEQAARLLYKEWFVHFRFPGHEHVKIVDGVPEGWRKVNVERLLIRHIGGGWGQDEPIGNETEPAYVIRGTDISRVVEGQFDSIGLRFHKENGLKNRLLKSGDIIFEVSGGSATQPVGRVLRINELITSQFEYDVIPASFCKLLRPESAIVSYYLYHHLKHIRESGELQVYQKQSASALQNFNFSAFMNHHLVFLPTQDLLGDFSEQVTLLEYQMANLAQQNTRLFKARDLLLPRLMNGEIAI